MYKVLVVGSGAWSETLAERYNHVEELEVSRVSYSAASRLDYRLLPRNDLYVLASRPANNFEFIKKYIDSEMNLLVEKPLIYDTESFNYFHSANVALRIKSNYQYLETPEWIKVAEECGNKNSKDLIVKITNLGPKRRTYLSPSLDYGSHVLSMVIDLKSKLIDSNANLEILESIGNVNAYRVKLKMSNIRLDLNYGVSSERTNSIVLGNSQCDSIFDLSGSRNYSNNLMQLRDVEEPILKTLRNSITQELISVHPDISRDLEIYELHQQIISF